MSQQPDFNRRKQYFIKKDFQIRFVLKFCALLLIAVALSSTLLYFFSRGTLTSSFEHSTLRITDTAAAILPAMLYTNLITLALVIAAAIGVTLFVSHKIAGPLFRFEKELHAIARGDLTKRMALRQNDQGKDMAESLNAMITSLHEKMVRIQEDVQRIRDAAEEQGVPETLVQQLDTLRRNISTEFRT
ncbi:MAG: methyl-accepting chemotaxis protein [Deltaproteobacteria bacterium]|nr:methyl-accepting chemotaxis protein [Deltaproteobacteria bacterium]